MFFFTFPIFLKVLFIYKIHKVVQGNKIQHNKKKKKEM